MSLSWSDYNRLRNEAQFHYHSAMTKLMAALRTHVEPEMVSKCMLSLKFLYDEAQRSEHVMDYQSSATFLEEVVDMAEHIDEQLSEYFHRNPSNFLEERGRALAAFNRVKTLYGGLKGRGAYIPALDIFENDYYLLLNLITEAQALEDSGDIHGATSLYLDACSVADDLEIFMYNWIPGVIEQIYGGEADPYTFFAEGME